MTNLYHPDDDAVERHINYTLSLDNGDTALWRGHASELNPWAGQGVRFLRCEGGTYVNIAHVVAVRPIG